MLKTETKPKQTPNTESIYKNNHNGQQARGCGAQYVSSVWIG